MAVNGPNGTRTPTLVSLNSLLEVPGIRAMVPVQVLQEFFSTVVPKKNLAKRAS
jgi:hypothetical protein